MNPTLRRLGITALQVGTASLPVVFALNRVKMATRRVAGRDRHQPPQSQEPGMEFFDEASPVLTRLQEAVGNLDDGTIFVGVRGTKGSDLPMIAMVNEFGSRRRNIPERSFLRSTMRKHRAKYQQLLQEAIEKAMDGQPQRRAMERIGALVVGDVQRTMTELKNPPNAPSTIAKKGSANPLIDTGRLRQSIDADVEMSRAVSR